MKRSVTRSLGVFLFLIGFFIEFEVRALSALSAPLSSSPSAFLHETKIKPKSSKRVKILSIDGGGIRGLIPALVLKNLEGRLKNGRHLADCFDIMAGTSTGSLIVLLLNARDAQGRPKYSIDDVLALYHAFGREIFSRSLWQQVSSGWGWLGPKYSTENLAALLSRYLGNEELKETPSNVLVPAYEIEMDKMMFFKTTHAKSDPDRNYTLKDIALAATAAPTYFNPVRIVSKTQKQTHTFVDGGVAVNNPTLSAAVYGLELYGYDEPFLVVSLGTGTTYGANGPRIPHEEVASAGIIGWAQKIVPLMMYAVNEVTDHEMRVFNQLPGTREYYRIQGALDAQNAEMDDVSPENLQALEAYAQSFIRENESALQAIADLLNE